MRCAFAALRNRPIFRRVILDLLDHAELIGRLAREAIEPENDNFFHSLKNLEPLVLRRLIGEAGRCQTLQPYFVPLEDRSRGCMPNLIYLGPGSCQRPPCSIGSHSSLSR